MVIVSSYMVGRSLTEFNVLKVETTTLWIEVLKTLFATYEI